jgi:hypothetical protein
MILASPLCMESTTAQWWITVPVASDQAVARGR